MEHLGLSDFPELAHLILTKILFKYCYYPPFYRQGNCGPEVLSGWQEVRIPFPGLSVRSELKAQGSSHCPMRVAPRGCSGVQAGTEQPALLTPPTRRPPANQKLHCGARDLTQAPRPEAGGSRPESRLAPPRKGSTRRQEARKAKRPLKQKQGVLALDGTEKEKNRPGQASGRPEARPLPGREDSGTTTFRRAKASHLIPTRILLERGGRSDAASEDTKLPQTGAGAEAPGCKLGLAAASPASHPAMFRAFVIQHPTVPAKSLGCHRQAQSRRTQNNSGETSRRRKAPSRREGASGASLQVAKLARLLFCFLIFCVNSRLGRGCLGSV